MLKVLLLGTGCPTPQPLRYGSSYVVQINDELVMFDCGPAITQRLAASSIRSLHINTLFFTHHHFDHDADFPAFYLTRWDQGAGKARPLKVFGPHGTERFTDLLFGPAGAFLPDIIARCKHPISQRAYMMRGGTLPRLPPEVAARDIQPGLVYSGPDYEVTAAPAIHAQPYLDSLAYRVDSEEGSVVITGDTGPCASVVRLARGADILVLSTFGPDDAIPFTDLREGFVGHLGAARIAAQAEAKKLVLVHFTEAFARPGVLAQAVEAARGIFPGQVMAGEDLMEVTPG